MDVKKIDSLKKYEFNPIIKNLWDEFKKVVKEKGRGKESKEILVKIYCLTPRE
jgi:hypothetical protein